MTYLSSFIDYFLYLLVALCLALITWKGWELYWPRPGSVRPARLGQDENQLQEALERLETGMTVLAAIGGAAPFIGLMGTVFHIIEALRHLGAGAPDMALIGGPIATALNTTLVGLFAAVPAVVAHTFFARRIELLESRHRRELGRSAT